MKRVVNIVSDYLEPHRNQDAPIFFRFVSFRSVAPFSLFCVLPP